MNPCTISPNAKTAPVYKPSLVVGSAINTSTKHYNRYKPSLAPKILKGDCGQFPVVALAHEVRNPLATINLSLEMLKSAIKDKDLNIYLDIIMRSSMRINNLINELLKSRQTDEIHAEKYSIQKLLDEVLEMAEDRINIKDISVRKEYAEMDFITALGKPEMKIALTNIIINAVDAMTSEGGQLKVVTKSVNGKYLIQIEDNGCGISERDLKHIFKPYFTNKPGGMGLGLATTYDILRSNHVEVDVESQEGTGTRFILSFECTRENYL